MTTTPFLKTNSLYVGPLTQTQNVGDILSCVQTNGKAGWVPKSLYGASVVGQNFGVVAKHGTEVITNDLNSNVGSDVFRGDKTGPNGVCVGVNTSTGLESVSIGDGASVSLNTNNCLTILGSCFQNNSIALGSSSSNNGTSCISIGTPASSAIENGLSIGFAATSGGSGIAIGSQAAGTTENSVCIGRRAVNTTNGNKNNVVIGTLAVVGNAIQSSENCVAIGKSAGCLSANNCISIGTNSQTGNLLNSLDSAIAIGNGAIALHTNSVCLGPGIESTAEDSFSCVHRKIVLGTPPADISGVAACLKVPFIPNIPNPVIPYAELGKMQVPASVLSTITSGIFDINNAVSVPPAVGTGVCGDASFVRVFWMRIGNNIHCTANIYCITSGPGEGTLTFPVIMQTGTDLHVTEDFFDTYLASGSASAKILEIDNKTSFGFGLVEAKAGTKSVTVLLNTTFSGGPPSNGLCVANADFVFETIYY